MVNTSVRADASLQPARATRRGDLLFTGGIVALDHDGAVAHPGNAAAQARRVLESITALLTEYGGSLDDIVCVTSYHVDPRTMEDVLAVAREFFPGDAPAWTPVGFLGCQHPGALVMVRAIAHLGPSRRRCLVPDSHAWQRRYPMSAACGKDDLLFIAGQSAADAGGQIEAPLDHCRQARRSYDRMLELLDLAGGSVDDVIDFTSFHHDIRGAIPTLEDIYIPDIINTSRGEEAATTSHIGSTGLLRPDMLGVYTAVADLGGGKRVGCTPEIVSWNASAGYPIAAAARKQSGRLITVAGQVSCGPDGNVLHEGDLEAQLRFIFEEIHASISGLGASMADVAEVCSYHKDPRSWDLVRRVAAEFFAVENPPTWSFVGTPGLWREGYHHEIAAMAVLDGPAEVDVAVRSA